LLRSRILLAMTGPSAEIGRWRRIKYNPMIIMPFYPTQLCGRGTVIAVFPLQGTPVLAEPLQTGAGAVRVPRTDGFPPGKLKNEISNEKSDHDTCTCCPSGLQRHAELLGAEVAYRYSLYSRMKNHPTYWASNDAIYEYHQALGYTYVPNKRSVEVRVSQGNPVLWLERFTDESGNMTRVRHENGGKGYRILVLGDSYTSDQREGSTWPDLLQEKLDARFPGLFHVINCGRSMYGILQMFDLAEAKVKEMRPDLVIVAFITDDLRRCRFWMTVDSGHGTKRVSKRTTPLQAADAAPYMDSFLVNPSITRSWCESATTVVKPNDPLLEAMNDQYRRILMEDRYRDVFLCCSTSFLFNRIVHGDAFRGVLGRLREPSLEADAYRNDNQFRNRVASLNVSRVPYLLIHLPTYRDLRDQKFWINSTEKEILQSLAELTGKNIVNLLNHASDPGEPVEPLFLLPHDSHPSRRGLEFLADSVFNLLVREGLTETATRGGELATAQDRGHRNPASFPVAEANTL
jgi:hypothetical protein